MCTINVRSATGTSSSGVMCESTDVSDWVKVCGVVATHSILLNVEWEKWMHEETASVLAKKNSEHGNATLL